MKTVNIIILSLSIIISSCTNSKKSEKLVEQQVEVTNTHSQAKFGIFNDIPKLLTLLSQNGIGQLSKWKSDEMGGFMSITDYFPFGDPSEVNGMQNNLAYYLESDNEKYVKTLKLVLNINNKIQNKQALSKLKEKINKTFKSLSIMTPDGLYSSLKNEKDTQFDNEQYKVELKSDISNIVTWTILIETN